MSSDGDRRTVSEGRDSYGSTSQLAVQEDDSDHNSSRFDANLEAEEAAEELDKEHLRLTIEVSVNLP